MDNIKVLKIEPGMINDVVKLHKVAFKDYLSTKLGDYYIKKMIKWFVLNKECISYCIFLNNEMAGYVMGAPKFYNKRLNKYIFFPALFSLLKKIYIIFDINFWKKIYWRLIGAFNKVKEQEKSKEFILVSIGVSKDFSNKGFGKILVEEFEKEARKRNYQFIKLSVFSDNINAIKFYEKLNYVKIFENKYYLIFYKDLIKNG